MIPWWDVKLEGTELDALEGVLNSGFLNEGPITEVLEKKFSRYLDVENTIFSTSGTISLYLALKASGIGPGNTVAVPNLTFIATANAVKLCGAEVCLIDVELETLCMSNNSLLSVLEDNVIDAIIVVHVSGRSAFTPQLLQTIQENDILLFEDAAEAFGSKDPASGKYLGTIGLAGAYSFSPNKVITSGQGGAVVTSHPEIAKRIRELKDQGRPQRGTGGADLHPGIGFNFKFTDIQSSILGAQFHGLKSRLEHLTEVYLAYRKSINLDLEAGRLLDFDVANGEVPLWPEYTSVQRNLLLSHFDANKIGYRKIWHPLSSQPSYISAAKNLANSYSASTSTFWLPSSFHLAVEDIEKVSRTINEFTG